MSLTVSYFLRNVDPITKRCLWTADEGIDLFFPRGFPISDLWRLSFNLIYRFGNIYDRIYEIADVFALDLVTTYFTDIEWQYVGGLFGKILVEILFPE